MIQYVFEPLEMASDTPRLSDSAHSLFSFTDSHMFSYVSCSPLHDALNPPCLHFDLRPSILMSVMYPWFQTSTLTSHIVADTVGTPQFDL